MHWLCFPCSILPSSSSNLLFISIYFSVFFCALFLKFFLDMINIMLSKSIPIYIRVSLDRKIRHRVVRYINNIIIKSLKLSSWLKSIFFSKFCRKLLWGGIFSRKYLQQADPYFGGLLFPLDFSVLEYRENPLYRGRCGRCINESLNILIAFESILPQRMKRYNCQ